MSVYREIPLTFGTLVLIRPKYDPGVNRGHQEVSSDTACDIAAGAETERDPLDLETASLDSEKDSADLEMLVSGNDDEALKITPEINSRDYRQLDSKTHSAIARPECGPKLTRLSVSSHLSSLWATPAKTFVGVPSNREVTIGPTTHGTVTAQKPYACDVCGRPFRRKKDIRRHISTHSNDKPFFCWLCCLSFRSRDYLRRHLKRVHLMEGLSEVEFRTNVDRIEREQYMVGNPATSGQSMAEPIQNLPREKHFSDARQFPIDMGCPRAQQKPLSQECPAEEELQVGDRSGDGNELNGGGTEQAEVAAMETDPDSDVSAQKPYALQVPVGSSAQSESMKTEEAAQSKRDACTLYLCDGCGNLMHQNHVIVLSSKQAAPSSRARVLCKMCVIKKTGIICIG